MVANRTDSSRTEDIQAITRTGLKPPEELYVMITTGCNLQCRHCWPQSVPLSSAISITPQVFELLIENFIRLGVHSIHLTGGEPLTHPNWEEMAAHAAERNEIDRVYLQTNGTLLTTEQIAGIKKLPQEKIRLQISLEGARSENHDAIRGNGTFDQTISGLRRLKEVGLGENVTVTFTETQSNIDDIPELLSIAESLGVGRFVSGCLVTKGHAQNHSDLALPQPGQYTSLLHLYHNDMKFRDLYDRMGNFAAIEWFKGKSYPLDNTCRCMRTPYITPLGDLYPCNMLLVDRWRLDRVFERPFDEVIDELLERWRNIPGIYRQRSNLPNKCRSCFGGDHCGGGCLGRVTDIESDCKGVEDRCELRRAVYSWKREG